MSAEDDVWNPHNRVRNVVRQGSDFEFSAKVPVKRYIRCCSEMLKMAAIYENEGNLEQALMLYSRYITLCIEKLPQHPEYKAHCKEAISFTKELNFAFGRAEEIKQCLVHAYELDAERHRMKMEELAARRAAANHIDTDDTRITAGGHRYITTFGNEGEILINTDDISYPEFDGKTIPSAPPMPSSHHSTSIPAVDRATKPKDSGDFGQANVHGLREVVVPSNVVSKFMALAEQNTIRNVETCGILCGKLEKNRFIITHVVVPKQSGTSDSCATEHEEDVFDFQDKYNLITLGWIHTHPTQSAFLSSVDMHTHCSYQLMLPEAVAVVCAPKYNDVGVFMLTPDVGLKEISSCGQKGFHPHEQTPPLFGTSPHAYLSDAYSVTVADLR